MIEDGTGIRHHAQAFGDVGTVIPPIILYRKVRNCHAQKTAYLWAFMGGQF